jgi:hypothetical protein
MRPLVKRAESAAGAGSGEGASAFRKRASGARLLGGRASWRALRGNQRKVGEALAEAGDLGIRKKRRRRRKVERTDAATGTVVTEEVEEDDPDDAASAAAGSGTAANAEVLAAASLATKA